MNSSTSKTELLSDFELNQPGVAKIVGLLEDRLVKHRLANDSFDADMSTRGRIAEIKYILKVLNTADGRLVGTDTPTLRRP